MVVMMVVVVLIEVVVTVGIVWMVLMEFVVVPDQYCEAGTADRQNIRVSRFASSACLACRPFQILVVCYFRHIFVSDIVDLA